MAVKGKLKRIIDKWTEDYTHDGYNKPQAKSLAWADFFEGQEIKYGLGYNKQYDCYCHDCKEGRLFSSSDSIRLFIRNHKDHKTRTRAM